MKQLSFSCCNYDLYRMQLLASLLRRRRGGGGNRTEQHWDLEGEPLCRGVLPIGIFPGVLKRLSFHKYLWFIPLFCDVKLR